jgi:hypothetical protein
MNIRKNMKVILQLIECNGNDEYYICINRKLNENSLMSMQTLTLLNNQIESSINETGLVNYTDFSKINFCSYFRHNNKLTNEDIIAEIDSIIEAKKLNKENIYFKVLFKEEFIELNDNEPTKYYYNIHPFNSINF